MQTEKNLYILIPVSELHERYLRIFEQTLPNIGDNIVIVKPNEYQISWYGNNFQIELKESVYLERKSVFDKMNAIVTDSSEDFLKKFPHPKSTSDYGNFFISANRFKN